jgi:CHAT domain-containing protein
MRLRCTVGMAATCRGRRMKTRKAIGRLRRVMTFGSAGSELARLLDRVLNPDIDWGGVRDFVVEHPQLLTGEAIRHLERRAEEARVLGDEGLAVEVDDVRKVLVLWSGVPSGELALIDVEQPISERFERAGELMRRFHATAEPDAAEAAARAWVEAVDSEDFDREPSGAQANVLFKCFDACREAHSVTSKPEFLDAALRTADRLVSTPIPGETVPGALARWGQAFRLRYWAHFDPQDAHKALEAFRLAYEHAAEGSEERALNACQYAQSLHDCATAARMHIGALEGVQWEQLLAQAIDLLRAELPGAPAGAAGALAYALARALADLGEPDPGEEPDAGALAEALKYARCAAVADLPSLERLRARVLAVELTAQLHEVNAEGDSEAVNRRFRETVAEAAVVSPEVACWAATSWGRWALRQRRAVDAVEAFEAGISASEKVVREQVSWHDREIWLGLWQRLTPNAALALVLTGEKERAVEVLDRGRRSFLTEGLRDDHHERREILRTNPGLAARLDSARAQLRAAVVLSTSQEGTSASQAPAESRSLVHAARDRVAAIEAEIRHIYPTYGQPWSYARIAEATNGQPLVYIAACESSGLLVRIDPHTKHISVELPGDLRHELLVAPLARYLQATESTNAPAPQSPTGTPAPGWRGVLEATADWLGKTVRQPLLNIAKGTTSLRVVVVGDLGLFPLHLARSPDAFSATGYRYLLDDLSLSLLPSASFLPRGSPSGEPGRVPSATIIQARDPSLDGPDREVNAIATTLGVALSAERASRESVMRALSDTEMAHVACHGIADVLHPLDSALLIGDSERITVRDLLASPGFTPGLVVMSACQSATSGAQLPDEAVSLPTALLQAGAGAAIGSLWAVPDAPTALLMARFYELWRHDGHEPPHALRLAQIWLRDSRNSEHAERYPSVDLRPRRLLPEEAQSWGQRRGYANPDCWGAFVFSGSWSAGVSA